MQFPAPPATESTSLAPRGPVLVDYECPSCLVTSSAPLRKIADGPVGYWCCDACDRTFRVRVDLQLTERSPSLPGETRQSPVCSPQEAKLSAQQQMLELCGESLWLRSQLAEMEDAATGMAQSQPN